MDMKGKLVPRSRLRNYRAQLHIMAAISFYKELDNLTTADFYTDSKKRKRRKLDYAGKYFVVDRLIAERSQRNVSWKIIVIYSIIVNFKIVNFIA